MRSSTKKSAVNKQPPAKRKATKPGTAVAVREKKAVVQAVPQPKGGKKKAKEPITPYATFMHDEAVATELARNAHAREKYVFLLRTLYVVLALLGVSLAGNIMLGLQEPEFRYFSSDPSGRIQEIIPLERPLQSETEVLTWVSGAISQAYTLSFADYQQTLQQARSNFTSGGWRGFQEALNNSGNLDRILSNMFVATAVPAGAPVVVVQGLVDGRYAWVVEMPLLVTYESAGARQNERMVIEATVVRRPVTEHPRGLGIAQIVAR